MEGGESDISVLQVLADRCLSLEASHSKLKDQFDVLVQENILKKYQEEEETTAGSSAASSSHRNRATSSGIVYRKVLDCMGLAVCVTGPVSGEIIYWSRPAENLYGYKESEVLGQRALEVLNDEEHYVSAERIMGTGSTGQSWSGQFPFKKRSGEVFMALVTKSPLYGDGELIGDIFVSSDAAVFNKLNSDNLRTNGQNRVWGLNLKKIQWPPKPQLASPVSNLASKVLSRKQEEECTTSRDGEGTDQEPQDVISESPPKAPVKPTFGSFSLHSVKKKIVGESSSKDESTSESATLGPFSLHTVKKKISGESSDKDESTSETSQPSKLLAAKLLSKLSRSLTKEEDNSFQQNGNINITLNNSAVNVSDDSTSSMSTISNLCTIDAEQEKHVTHEVTSIPGTKRSADINLVISGQLDDVREFEKDTVHRQGDAKQFTNSNESGSGGSGTSSSKIENDLNLVVDIEIRWEDINFRDEIGQGSFALVYRGIWKGSDVAVKVYFGNQYSEEALHDYKKEVNIMRRLRHPNVLLFMGAVYSPEKLAMVTEFFPRGSLFKTLHKSGQSLDIKRRLRMALDVVRGMNYLHHRNPPIVHRDLKSSNLLVDKNWKVKVGDFGLSKMKNATFITARSGRGTPQWMAPEVLRNELSNEKSDVFSFGVILWELITESIPWKDLNSLQVVGVVGFTDRRWDLPEDLDPFMSSIIHDCWQSNAELRPSFKELIPRVTDLISKAPGMPTRKSSEN